VCCVVARMKMLNIYFLTVYLLGPYGSLFSVIFVFWNGQVILWTCGLCWRQKKFVKRSVGNEWDVTAMAIIWLVWNERNNRVFSEKYRHSLALLFVINSFVVFWLDNLSPKLWRQFVTRQGPYGVGRV